MTAQISLDEAARRIHKNRDETYALLRAGAFAGCYEDVAFVTVDPVSLDQYIQNNRHPAQRPLIPANAEVIAARAAWTEAEEAVIRGCQDRYEAISAYRLEFVNSHRTDYAIGKHWYRMRSRKPEKAGGIWSWICSLFRKAAGV
jgi:hypothetical protein